MNDTVPLSIAVHTLGCKVNRWDTEALLKQLPNVRQHGFNQPSDIYIINTCTVTHAGDKKSLQMIRRARRLAPSAFVAVCGCMPRSRDSSPEKIYAAGANFIFDTRKPEELLAKIEELFPAQSAAKAQDNIHHETRTRAYIKIQDGCDRYCTYCIVPYVRGPVTSRPPEDILNDAAQCVARGAKEIVLTGIQVAAYGYDTGSEYISLPALIKLIAARGPKRLRLSSIDPWAINATFLEAAASTPSLCGHFHLSLQSGSSATLARMNRRYTTHEYAAAAAKLKALRPNMALTTDIIVGFPGESDEDFQASLDFAREMGFSRIHVFEYSPRAGTLAANMPGQVPSQVKTARGQAMRALAKTLEQQFLESQIGTTTLVLFESQTATDRWKGHTENYCPVTAQGQDLANVLINVKITGVADNTLVGELTNQNM